MIRKQDLDFIQALPGDKMVLMAVVNDNPSLEDNTRGAVHTRVKGLMNDLGVPPTLMNRVLDDLTDASKAPGKSAVYVVGEDVFERYDVQADLPERVHYGRPLRSLVMNVLDLMPRAGVLAVDREWARFFVLEQGELTEVRKDANEGIVGDAGGQLVQGTQHTPGSTGGAGSDQGSGPRSDSGNELFQKYQDAQQQRFYHEVITELGKLMKVRQLPHLVLVGPVERVSEFRAELPAHPGFEVIGETNVSAGAGWADAGHILERVMPIVQEYVGTEEEGLMQDIQEKGIMEMEPVLKAVQQGRVYQLVIPGDGSQVNLLHSVNPEVPYFTSRKNMQESPLDGSTLGQVTLEEVLPQLTDLYGVEIRRVHGERADKLVKEYGGLAALVRY